MAPTPLVWITVGCTTGGSHWSFNPNTADITDENTVVGWALSATSQQKGWQLTDVFFTPTAGWTGLTPAPVVLPISQQHYGFVLVDTDSVEETYNYQVKIQTSTGTYTSPDPQIENEPPMTVMLRRRIEK